MKLQGLSRPSFGLSADVRKTADPKAGKTRHRSSFMRREIMSDVRKTYFLTEVSVCFFRKLIPAIPAG